MEKYANRYKDGWLLILVPVFGVVYRHTGETEPLQNLLSTRVYYLDVATSIAVIAVIWTGIRLTISQLDRQLAWEEQPLLRALVQAVIVYGFTIVVTALVSFFYNETLMTRPPEFNLAVVFAYDVPFACLMVTIIQLAYGLLYMHGYYEYRLRQQKTGLAAATGRKTVVATFGKSQVPLNVSSIAFFYKAGDMVRTRTFDGKDYTMDEPLDSLEEQLSGGDFFRINRQHLAHRRSIIAMQPDASGKITLSMVPKPDGDVTVSKKKAKEFKQWMEN